MSTLNRIHIFDIRRRRRIIFAANFRHSLQTVWQSEDAVRTLPVGTHPFLTSIRSL